MALSLLSRSETTACSSKGLTSELSFLGPIPLYYSTSIVNTHIPSDTLAPPSQAPTASPLEKLLFRPFASPHPRSPSPQLPARRPCLALLQPLRRPHPCPIASTSTISLTAPAVYKLAKNRKKFNQPLEHFKIVKSYITVFKTHRIRNHVRLTDNRDLVR